MKGLFRRGTRSSYHVVLIAGATAGMVIGGGLITARATSDQIHACKNKGSGGLRVVSGPDDCNGSETPLSWNAQGNAGVPGPTGPAGPPGPAGAGNIDALLGQSCNVGSSNEGTLVATYGSDGTVDPVALGCKRNVPEFVLTTKLHSGMSYFSGGTTYYPGGVLTSEPASVNCTHNGGPINSHYSIPPVSCVADFLPGTEVTLYAAPDKSYPAGTWRAYYPSALGCVEVAQNACRFTITKNTVIDVTFRV